MGPGASHERHNRQPLSAEAADVQQRLVAERERSAQMERTSRRRAEGDNVIAIGRPGTADRVAKVTAEQIIRAAALARGKLDEDEWITPRGAGLRTSHGVASATAEQIAMAKAIVAVGRKARKPISGSTPLKNLSGPARAVLLCGQRRRMANAPSHIKLDCAGL